ncbi:nickel-dependent hydrogenase large subunit [Geoalkalibacter halelectricus]|uniref:Nickel-dependent hydrogenase large subunit n=1 Tax=Geoalkalibacter halelectricus TaxID=2847045 RepID=A0ABY5ZMI1_9BACT|nr:nickel-dependent hydrogenase large subunit [Geoalkalibacter halelectricus]MDO3378372.1 nickel-dependent hydrogenase large subunit [Geoalkalibacter halelectricus]UWZ80308.1 nickel-dependent hydrogenase large subunit [Geoalkalibacter halelectricus]
MAQKIVVDPITRIEGHLRIEAKIENGRIVDAWSSSTAFRGIETILKGRDPRDAHHFTQRFCGVCTTVHSMASIRCVEDALKIQIPDNARLIRNLIMAAQNVQDHIIHFYHLHALDWVDIVSALEADPAATSKLAQSISDYPKSSTDYFRGIQERVKAFAGTGRLGPFQNAYWGHSAYKLPPEANLMAVAHYLEALDIQREIIKIHAILGSKNPHPQTFLVGGMAIPVDPDSQNAINADRIAQLRRLFRLARTFTEQVYIPDLLAVASFYTDWAGIGAGVGNYLCFGDFPLYEGGGKESYYFPQGIILGRDLSRVLPVDQQKITEYVSRSWYTYAGGDARGLHPWQGETSHRYTGPKPPYEWLDTDAKYSWVKAPRYEDQPMEVGPLARILVAYASGHQEVQAVAHFALNKLGVGPEVLFSTLGRTAARGLETLLLAQKAETWLDQLTDNMGRGIYEVHNGEKWDPASWPREAQGFGYHEAPRGALGHWIRIERGAIANFQAVVPSTWNAGPRCANNHRGPYEEALIGTPVADEKQPLEILRTIHSFDPCLACAVHVLDAKGNEIIRVKAL